jgi:hypothetical protein
MAVEADIPVVVVEGELYCWACSKKAVMGRLFSFGNLPAVLFVIAALLQLDF